MLTTRSGTLLVFWMVKFIAPPGQAGVEMAVPEELGGEPSELFVQPEGSGSRSLAGSARAPSTRMVRVAPWPPPLWRYPVCLADQTDAASAPMAAPNTASTLTPIRTCPRRPMRCTSHPPWSCRGRAGRAPRSNNG